MSMKELLLGKKARKATWHRTATAGEGGGKDAWNHAFAKVFNPLRIQPQDQVEVRGRGRKPYTTQTVLWYHPTDGQPDSVRYGIRSASGTEFKLLEVVRDGYNQPVYSLFEHVDEFDWDEELVKVLEDQDELQQSASGSDGEKELLVYFKDFVTKATVHVFNQTGITEYDVVVYNYFFETDSGEERYLTVELIGEQWISFYQGFRISKDDFEALGTWLSN